MDGDLKVGDVLTEAEIGRAWDLYMGCGDAGTFRARCMPGIVLPAVARLGEMPDRDGYAEKVFSALAYGLRMSLKAAADGITHRVQARLDGPGRGKVLRQRHAGLGGVTTEARR